MKHLEFIKILFVSCLTFMFSYGYTQKITAISHVWIKNKFQKTFFEQVQNVL